MQKLARQILRDQCIGPAHDAFGYFGCAYGFEVLGLQGLYFTEAGTADVRQLALKADRQIPAIFGESSIPRQLEAVRRLLEHAVLLSK